MKKRHPLVALILSVLVPGLGQIYNGQFLRGLIFFVISLGLFFLYYVLCKSFSGFVISVVSGVIFFVGMLIDAAYQAIRHGEVTLKKYNRWYYYPLFALLALGLCTGISYLTPFTSEALKSYRMPSQGMHPTLQPGDRFVIDQYYYRHHSPQRGEVAVYSYPVDPGIDFVHRIIGLPGETIQMDGGKVSINGKMTNEPYAVYLSPITKEPMIDLGEPLPDFPATQIPADAVFVMGDNRSFSNDSRQFGFVQLSLLKGKVMYLYWSEDKSRIGLTFR